MPGSRLIRLFNMLPLYTVNNIANGLWANSVNICQILHRIVPLRICLPNLTHIFFGQFSYVMCLTFAMSETFWLCFHGVPVPTGNSLWMQLAVVLIAFQWVKSTLVSCVNLIVFIGSQKQMVRIHARRIITVVQHKHLPRIDLRSQKVRDPTGDENLTSNLKVPVTVIRKPKPALTGITLGVLVHENAGLLD